MSYKVEILEDDDFLTADLYCRPLYDVSYSRVCDEQHTWVRIDKHLGEFWYGSGTKKVKDFKLPYEFMRKL